MSANPKAALKTCASCNSSGEIVVDGYGYRCLMCRPEKEASAKAASPSQAKVTASAVGAYLRRRLAKVDDNPATRLSADEYSRRERKDRQGWIESGSEETFREWQRSI